MVASTYDFVEQAHCGPHEAAYYWRLRNTFLEFQVLKPCDDDDGDSECRDSNSSGRSLSVDSFATRRDSMPFVPSTVAPVHSVRIAALAKAEKVAKHVQASVAVTHSVTMAGVDVRSKQVTPAAATTSAVSIAEVAKIPKAEGQHRVDMVELTTVMIRNIACKFKEADVQDVLDRAGFEGTYSAVRVPRSPVARMRQSNLGYAFVTFSSADFVQECREVFDGHRFGSNNSLKKCEIVLTTHSPMKGHTHGPRGTKKRMQPIQGPGPMVVSGKPLYTGAQCSW